MAEQSIQNTTSRRGERPSVKSVEVASFTTPGRSYRVYPDYGYCSCPHHTNTGAECKHIRLLTAPEYTITHVYRYGRYVYEIHDSEGGYEGCVPSFADAFDVVTEDLGGVLGAPGVGGYFGSTEAEASQPPADMEECDFAGCVEPAATVRTRLGIALCAEHAEDFQRAREAHAERSAS